jgi:hypothetical protein
MSVSISGDGSVTGIDQGFNIVGVLTASGGFSGNLTGNVTGTVNSSGIITASGFTGNLTGNVNATGLSTFSGGIVVSVGSTSTPSISPSGDSNTGIFFPSADTIAFGEGGVESARFDNSGNLQLSTANTSILNSSGRKILNQTGGILQVVQTIKTDTFTSSSTSPTAITGLSASITPSSTSSRILVMYSVNYDSNRGNSGGGFRIYRDGSHITAASGAAAGSRYTVTGDFGSNNDADQSGMHRSFTYIDSPSSTSSLTYQIYIVQDSTFTTYINRSRADADQGDDGRYSSTITLMEISG